MPDTTADRIAVDELLARYTWAIDSKQWDELPALFIPQATLDYRDLAGESALYEGLEGATEFLKASLGWRDDAVPWHFFSNGVVDFDDGTAHGRYYMHNRHLTVLGRYFIDCIRTAEGWRIRNLTLRAITRREPLPDAPMGPPAEWRAAHMQ